MSREPFVPRHARRAATIAERREAREHAREKAITATSPVRRIAFALVAVTILAIGGYLGFGDFLGQRGVASSPDAISVQASMAGFTPAEIRVKAGAAVTLDFWTQDASPHLEHGVHTMISDELGLHVELPGADLVSESRVAINFTAPAKPGAYDIYCDTCCGGQENPTMHGRIVVEA